MRSALVVAHGAGTAARIRAAVRSAAIDLRPRTVTGDTREALDALRDAEGDLVVLEDSPTLGFDALEALQATDARTRSRCVVVLAAGVGRERIERLLRAGAAACILQPAELVEALREVTRAGDVRRGSEPEPSSDQALEPAPEACAEPPEA